MNPSEIPFPKADTYEVLEFQGYVADVPTYDKESGKLEFVARAANRPTLAFFAQSELGKAFRVLIHKGSMVQIQAFPFPHIEEVGGKKCRVLSWEAKRIQLLGHQKINLGKFSDVRILDGLMPGEDELQDVGYVDPIFFARDQERDSKGEKLLEEKKELEKEEGGHD